MTAPIAPASSSTMKPVEQYSMISGTEPWYRRSPAYAHRFDHHLKYGFGQSISTTSAIAHSASGFSALTDLADVFDI